MIIMLLCAAMFGIGCLSFLIDLRTCFGPQFRYFAIQLMVFPAMGLIDQWSYWPGLPPHLNLLLTRIFHMLACFFILNSVHFMQRITAKDRSWIFRSFALATLFCLPLIFTPWMFRLEGETLLGGPIYGWTFYPYGAIFVLAMYYFLVEHLLISPPGRRKFPVLHLMSWMLISVAGLLSMTALIFPSLNSFFTQNLFSFSVLPFGFMCAYFFADQFFGVLREREGLFRRLEVLSLDMERLKPLGRLGESAAHISHEIKNYVGALKSNNVLLKNRLKDSGDFPEMERIARSAERLEQFARSVMDYSHGTDPASFKPLRLDEVIRETVRLHFPDRQAHITVDAEAPPWVRGDASSLERAFVNLIKNSFEADAGEVNVRMREEGGGLSVLLEDDGRGCAPGDLPRLTSPFFTTKKDQGGTGLGLCIASAIVRNHGGTFEHCSRNHARSGERGMEFKFTFPSATT